MGEKVRTTKWNYAGEQEGSSNYQNKLEKREKNLQVTACLWSFVQVPNNYRGSHLLKALICSAKVLLSHIENPFK